MKVTCVFVAALATASAFAPSVSNGRVATELMAAKKDAPKKETLFSTIFNMDLFAPNKDVNDYGARNKKPVSINSILKQTVCNRTIGCFVKSAIVNEIVALLTHVDILFIAHRRSNLPRLDLTRTSLLV
jgi:hypothetical protein